MQNSPRSENQLQPGTQRIQDRWISIRKNELKPLQFNLAHGLALLTLFAVVFAIARGCFYVANPEEAMALRIHAAGGTVTWEQSTFQSRPRIVGVSFRQRSIDGSLLSDVVQLTHLRELYLHDCRLLDADILSLQPSASLMRIQLDDNPITDQAVLHLASLPHLEAIDLRRCMVTDASLRVLAQCPSLWQLRLGDTLVTNPGLKSIAQCTQLRILGLVGTQVDDLGMHHLQELKHLVRLDLARTDVSEEAVAELNAILPKQPASR